MNDKPRRLFAQTVSKGDVIDIYGDTDTIAGRRSLVSKGNTFLSKTPNEVVNDNKAEQASIAIEVDGDAPLTTTKGRYDLRHGIASMLRPDDGTRGPAVCGCGLSGHNIDDVAVHLNDAAAGTIARLRT